MAIVVASIGIWLFHFMILRGVQQAAAINQIVTIAKIVPILIFIVILIFAFNADLFSANFYGGEGYADASLFEPGPRRRCSSRCSCSSGIEGASVYSRYAKKRSDVGAATIMGFVGVTSLMVLVTLLPYAVLKRAEIAGIRQPSMAGVLEAVVGPWGAVFISVGLLVSVLGRLPGVVADLRRGALRRREEGGHAAGVRDGEREQGAGGGTVADQHRGPVLRHHHVLVARRVHADAQPDERDGVDPVPAGGALRASCSSGAARPTR